MLAGERLNKSTILLNQLELHIWAIFTMATWAIRIINLIKLQATGFN